VGTGTVPASTMASCDHCGGHVSERFVRVFGESGTVHACPACSANAGIAEVAKERAN
jgi:hypothetical protein